MKTILAVLTLAFLVVQIISLLLVKRVAKHAGNRHAAGVHLLVAVVGAYYWLDVLLHRERLLLDPFFYFWIFIILSQIAFYATRRRTNRLDEDVDTIYLFKRLFNSEKHGQHER